MQAEVLARRAEEHRHLVEADAAARLVEHVARDLHGLAAFAGGREEDHVRPALGARRLLFRLEQISPQSHQLAVAGLLIDLDVFGEPLEWLSGEAVSRRHAHEPCGRAREERLDERALDGGVDRDVHEHDRAALAERRARLEHLARDGEQRGAVGTAARAELGNSRIVERGQIRTALPRLPDRGRRRIRHAEVLQRAREGRSEAGHPGNRGEVLELTFLRRLEDGAGGNGVASEAGGRREPQRGEPSRGKTRRELREAEPMHAECRGAVPGKLPRDVVGGASRRRHDQDLVSGRKRPEEVERASAATRRGR